MQSIKYYRTYIIMILVFIIRIFTMCGSIQNFYVEDCVSPKIYSYPLMIRVKNDFVAWSDTIKDSIYIKAKKIFPSPHSELLMGVTLGIDNLQSVPSFKDAVKKVGTIHVIVVSGYNIGLIYTSLMVFLKTIKTSTLYILVLSSLFYSLFVGFQPPIVRAWIMALFLILGKYYGRKIDPMDALLMSGFLMIVFDVLYFWSLSFQLSFMATLSLVYFSWIFDMILKSDNILIVDLKATLSAQILVWPIIAFNFGELSIISPIVNMLTLWVIPFATTLGSVAVFVLMLSDYLSKIISVVLIIPLDIFVRLNFLFARFSYSVINIDLSVTFLIIYYSLAFLFPYILRRHLKHD